MEYIFAVGVKSRCDGFCDDLNRLVPGNNRDKLRWYSGYRVLKDWDPDALTILRRGLRLVLLGIVRSRLLSTSTSSTRRNPWVISLFASWWGASCGLRPDISNAVSTVARYANKPREVHWGKRLAVYCVFLVRVISALRFRRAVG